MADKIVEPSDSPQLEAGERDPEKGSMDDEIQGHKEDVSHVEDLQFVDPIYLSGDQKRPLLFTDKGGNDYTYVLKPMFYCVFLILLMEALERLSYYGINFTQTSFLTGAYDEEWNAGFGGTEAASLTQTSSAIAYSAPFIGAIMADGFLGNFWTITFFSIVFYLPGLCLIAASAFPFGISDTFPTTLLTTALLVLYPIGAGGIKACVNVFGAQNFHIILQREMIEKYYISFYTFINIGSLVGGIVIPIVCQHNVFAAYMIPVCGLTLAIIAFLGGYSRYVFVKPLGSAILKSIRACGSSCKHCPPSFEKVKRENGGKYEAHFIEKVKVMLALFPIMGLLIPFNIVYGQMATTFVIQGTVMQPAGFVDANWMQNFDALSVLIWGAIISKVIYPQLAKRGIVLHVTQKFAIGTSIAALAVLCCIIVDYQIHSHYESGAGEISVFWQIFAYMLIGCGEIFAISSSYELAFVVSPEGFKTWGSSCNLFIIGGLPNFIATGILNACQSWWVTDDGGTKINTLPLYAQTEIYNYFWVLFAIAALGTIVCLLPPVKRFCERIEAKSMAISKGHFDE